MSDITTVELVYDHNFKGWIWCDFDGRGKKWRLAVACQEMGEPSIKFPSYGEGDDFIEDAENYADYPCVVIAPPPKYEPKVPS